MVSPKFKLQSNDEVYIKFWNDELGGFQSLDWKMHIERHIHHAERYVNYNVIGEKDKRSACEIDVEPPIK